MESQAVPFTILAPARVLALLQRLPWLLPVVSFAAGWASFWLVDRGSVNMARGIAALALIGWPWLLAESVLGQWLQQRTRGLLSVNAVRYLTQSLQLEMLFFSLPFLIGACLPDHGQILFTGLVMLAALVCSIDPLYMRGIGERPFASILFHAYCSFIGALVVLPLAAHLSVEISLPLALAFGGGMLVLSLPRALMQASAGQRFVRLLVIAFLPLLLWSQRAEIPTAGLRVTEARMTQTIEEPLTPGEPFRRISAADLHAHGALSFAAVRAPAGLSQSVEFVWRKNGVMVDRIPATLSGGRAEGYRLYSRKQAFPEDAQGAWTVDLVAPDRRLIYRWHFRVD